MRNQSPTVTGSNPVTPSKVYGLWANRGFTSVKIDEIAADSVDAALREGRLKWGKDHSGQSVVRSAILIPGQKQPTTTAEPMFLNE